MSCLCVFCSAVRTLHEVHELLAVIVHKVQALLLRPSQPMRGKVPLLMRHADMQIINDTLPALVKLRDSGKASLCCGHPSSPPLFQIMIKTLPVPCLI